LGAGTTLRRDSTMISVAKTSVQITIVEGAISELIGLLTEFIIKYHQNTSLNIKEVHYGLQLDNKIQEPFSNNCDILKISNLEYHKPKRRPLKHYKSLTEENSISHLTSSKTCSYYLKKEHNIRRCK